MTTVTDQSIRQHTSESAAKVIEILEQWKPVYDKYKSAKPEAKWGEPSMDKVMDLEGEHERLRDSAIEIMVHDVFDFDGPSCPDWMRGLADGLWYLDCMEWLYDDYEALIADLTDIARGDF